jgi:opacity protein-like surface antigen
MTLRFVQRALAPLFACLAVAGCGSASQLANPPQYAPADQTTSRASASPLKPLVVDWPSADRGALEARAQRGVVVVRYAGSEIQVLDRCSLAGSYRYSAFTPKRDRLVMRDADDLHANVPVSAARLGAKLQKSGELDVEMTFVGRWETDKDRVTRDELTGTCDGATHVVVATQVGAFSLSAGAEAQVGGSANAFGTEFGVGSRAVRETLSKDGEEDACSKARGSDWSPPEGCAAVIRLELVPVHEPTPHAACAKGERWDESQSKCVDDGSKLLPLLLLLGLAA